MPKVKQSKQELLEHLHENLGFLKASAAAFDAGHTGEARRLAVTIRVLLHDTKNSKSLLGLLGLKQNTGYLDTATDLNPKNLMSHHGLVGLKMGGGGGSYFAPLADTMPEQPNKYILFPDWWNKVVIKDSNKNTFNRRELVLALANKDGGAHVDPDLDQAYADLTRNNSVGWVFSNGTDSSPINEVELYSVRQIAYEVIASVERKLNK
jgi:hypothetical protein